MAQRLTSMSVDALLKLRQQIGAILSDKASLLKKELAALGDDFEPSRRPMRGSALAGIKVPPKYRGPNGQTWAGRGAQPVWLREALKGGKKKIDDFLIANGSGKRGRPKKKR